MSRVDRQGKLWPEQIQFMIITTILFTNTMFCKLTRSVCHQLKIDTRSRTGFYTLNLGQKIKNNSRHTSKALLIIFNFSSGWFCKENKNKNAFFLRLLMSITTSSFRAHALPSTCCMHVWTLRCIAEACVNLPFLFVKLLVLVSISSKFPVTFSYHM